jgi:DTW domain-containing protein YfiP
MNKRVRCPRCERAVVACFCHNITALDNALSVVILQHPSEVKHAKGTAKIVELSLNNCQLLVGEDFCDDATFTPLIKAKKSLLLYPNDNAISPTQLVAHLQQKSQQEAQQNISPSLADYQLIVIDGSWKKAYKIFCLNPVLATLPCIGIEVVNESNYRIRKSSRSDSLSTLEAIHSLLTTLEGDKFEGLLTTFNTMVDFQLQSMPKDVQARY